MPLKSIHNVGVDFSPLTKPDTLKMLHAESAEGQSSGGVSNNPKMLH